MHSIFLFLLFLLSPVLGAVYQQEDSHQGIGFFKSFGFQSIADPTKGRVEFVDQMTAQQLNLSFGAGDTFILRADSFSTLTPDGPGRQSFRLISNKQYQHGVTIFNVRHIPEGCGTWPALWTVGLNWPANGEIDILEGINSVGTNAMTLHTSPGCSMPDSRTMRGSVVNNDCDSSVNNNAGCGVSSQDTRSFGHIFNDHGGGFFAMERTSDHISVWFFSKSATNIPSDILNGATTVDTSGWGTPAAFFPNTQCDIDQHFGLHNIIIDLTFCGDWAGVDYAASGCPSTCIDFVDNNPEAFENAFFDFQWLKTYQ